MNKKINTIIDNYLSSTKQTDYAIMINGKWGCGKTYYVEHDLKELIINKQLKYIYISLNGCDVFNKISNKITYRLLIKNDSSEVDYNLIENLINLGAGLSELHKPINIIYKTIGKLTDILIKQKKEKSVIIFNPNKIVIIFDDVERISTNILRNDIIGLIYENYTKKGYKTILVGDETHMNDTQYNIIKEKIIRRTISYEPDRIVQLENFVNNQFGNSKYKYYFDENKEKIINYFIELKITNLRTISFIIDNFFYVIENIDDDMKNRFGDYLLKNIIILTNEYKSGNITIDNLNDKKELMDLTNKYFMDAVSIRNGKKRERTYLDDFHDKYIAIPTFNDFRLIVELFDFILTGYLDAKKLDIEIKSLFYDEFIQDSERTYNTLVYNWGDIEEDELRDEIEKFIQYIEEGKYHIAKLPYIYTYIKFIQESNFLIDWSFDLEKTIKNSLLKISQDQDMIPDNVDLIEYHNKFDETKPNDTFYNELIRQIKNLSEQKSITKRKDKVLAVFHAIKSNHVLYYESLYNNHTLFQDIIKTNSEMCIFELTNRGIGILQSYIRSNILRISNAGETRYDEKSALEKIISCIEQNLDVFPQKLNHYRIIRLRQLISFMGEAINHLENTHPKTH